MERRNDVEGSSERQIADKHTERWREAQRRKSDGDRQRGEKARRS